MRCAPTAVLSMLIPFAGLAVSAQEADRQPQQAAQPQAATYAGHRVVQVVPESGQRLARVLELSHHVWSERIGRGPIDVQVDADAFAALDAEGFEFTVLVDDVAGLVARERAAIDARALEPRRGGDAIDFNNYYPLADLLAFVSQLANERPDLVSTEIIGQSVQGRDIITMTITAPGDATNRPQIALNSLIHAREWITAPATLRLARDLVRGYGTDPRLTNLLDQVQFVITPVVNPDGYAYSWQNGSTRFWRKNRRNNGDGTFGVDLNRNWDINFGGNGADPFTNSDIYHGTGPFSEPETAVMRDKLTSLPDLRAHVDTHSYTQLILWSPGFVGQNVPREAELQALGTDLAQTILETNGVAYTPQRAIDLYEASGTFSDWSSDALGILSFTFELRPDSPGAGGFAPSPELILPTAQEINAAYLHLAEATALPLRFVLPSIASLQFDQPVSYDFSVLPGVDDPSSAVSVFLRQGNGSFVETAAQSLGNDRYRVTIDPAICGEDVELYVSALTSTSQAVTFPATGALLPVTIPVVNTSTVFTDTFATDLGWSVTNDANLTDGAWERGIPANGDRNDPAADFDGDGFAYLTDNVAGNSDVDSGATTLTSPALDASAGDATLTYAVWYSNTSSEDVLTVEVSGDNGASWQPADTVTSAGAWRERSIDVAALVGTTSQLRVRFTAADADPQSIVEAGIDAVRLLINEPCPATDCAADTNGDGQVTPADFNAWIVAFNANAPECDQNGDGLCNPADFNAWILNFNAGCE